METKQDISQEDIISVEEKLSQYKGEDEVISSDELREQLNNSSGAELQFNSGIPTFDRLCEGFEGGELVVIGGQTGMGKTTYAQTLTMNMANAGIDSLWFSYEVMPKQFLKKFPADTKFFVPKMLKDKTPNWLNAKVWEAKLKYGVKAVFIDHLHYLMDMGSVKNSSLEIGQIMRNLKKIAITHNIVIFLIAHTTKTKLETEPDNEHLRDSSFIAQEADCVMFVWRVPDRALLETSPRVVEYTNESVLKITKHRRTGVMGKKIHLLYQNNKLMEIAKVEENK